IILYGCLPDGQSHRTVEIKNVMNLSTQIADVREVPKGDYLSYGRLFQTARPSKIGILPIGYGDGVFRNLTNKAKVAIRGKLAPLVGRVCMDQILVDLTDISGARVGDRVDFFGNRRPPILTEEVAALAGTISYEITCHIGRRVPRVYLD
ncbi:MAG: alanine racemase C-terminal domain-containing protein, partial [bacterium]